jgi:cbb3-type cytochrome c oxidase subunit III
MENQPRQRSALEQRRRKWQWAMIALTALGLSACNMSPGTQSANSDAPKNPPGGHPLSEGITEEDYGEFVARPEELVAVPTNDIVKSIRLSAIATNVGRTVYAKNCASCHGEDLKGSAAAHAPDLTDADWRYSGDDLASGGLTKLPSDVEWTVRYGVRSGSPNARGVEADMLAFDPQYRNEHDLGDYGKIKTVTTEEIADLAEYVLQLSGQQADPAKADHGKELFLDNAKGNCFDCHTEEATGNPALGSTDLTRKDLYLFGSDRASIIESITKGRRGTMPGFEGTLKPEELKAVSVFVFFRAAKGPPPPAQ